MSIVYNIDVLEELKKKGYSTYVLRKEKLLGQAVIQQLREKKLVSWASIDLICTLLECRIEDLLVHRASDNEKRTYSINKR